MKVSERPLGRADNWGLLFRSVRLPIGLIAYISHEVESAPSIQNQLVDKDMRDGLRGPLKGSASCARHAWHSSP